MSPSTDPHASSLPLLRLALHIPSGWEETVQWQMAQDGWGDGVHEQSFPAGHLDDEPFGRPGEATLSFVVELADRAAFLERMARLALALDWPEHGWSVRSESAVRSDWETAWREKWKPFRCGGFVVHSDFHEGIAARLRPQDLPLVVPTGSAFGTGAHPSTRIALRTMRRWWNEEPVSRVLDVGMGTGILAVAAAKLGATQVHGMDPDPPAAGQAMKMAQLNGVAEACEFWQGVLESIKGEWQIVIANLQSSLLQRYSKQLRQRMGPQARLFAGGFMDRNAAATMAALESADLRLQRLHEHGRWRAAEFTCG
jgi:ribosomal protein L11 methyltransferase